MIVEFGEIFDWIKAAFAGFRYLIFASYREEKHAEWENEKTHYIIWDVCCGVISIAFFIAFLYWMFTTIFKN